MFTTKHIERLLAFVLVFSINGAPQNETIYILLWTYDQHKYWQYPYLAIETGQSAFVRRNCSFQNCYVTTNHSHFKNVLDFDVLVFNVLHLSSEFSTKNMPKNRSADQLYVFFAVEPAAYSPIPREFHGIFNLTWTYLLKSDIVHPYFFVKTNLDAIVGPKIDAHWMNITSTAVSAEIVEKLQRKSIAALWVVSNCLAKTRWIFVDELNNELSKYGHRVDVYGRCGDQTYCPQKQGDRNGLVTNCVSKIESDYYFYLAFENSLCEDYVTEKVLHGLLHFSVPIVYGGANYTRFLPNGIYLNALALGVKKLAQEMADIINYPQRYYDFFNWHNYYSFHDASDNDYRETVCAFCAYLNDKANSNKRQVYENITGWWNAPRPELFERHPGTISSPVLKGEIEEQPYEITTRPEPNTIFSKIIDFFLDFN